MGKFSFVHVFFYHRFFYKLGVSSDRHAFCLLQAGFLILCPFGRVYGGYLFYNSRTDLGPAIYGRRFFYFWLFRLRTDWYVFWNAVSARGKREHNQKSPGI